MAHCGGKKRYSKKEALTACNYRRKMGAVNLRSYHCPHCNLWHLTHRPDFKNDRMGVNFRKKGRRKDFRRRESEDFSDTEPGFYPVQNTKVETH